jgi:hypothetical protein
VWDTPQRAGSLSAIQIVRRFRRRMPVPAQPTGIYNAQANSGRFRAADFFFWTPWESTASQIENGQRDQANPLPTLAAKRDQAWEKEGRPVQWGEAGGPQVGLCGRQISQAGNT